jgi:hypothetical protein
MPPGMPLPGKPPGMPPGKPPGCIPPGKPVPGIAPPEKPPEGPFISAWAEASGTISAESGCVAWAVRGARVRAGTATPPTGSWV